MFSSLVKKTKIGPNNWGHGSSEDTSLPALLDRLQLLLRRPCQLLPHHPPHREKPLHILWHRSCPCTYQRRGYHSKHYFVFSRSRGMHLASSQIFSLSKILSSSVTLSSLWPLKYLLLFPRVIFSLSVSCCPILPSFWTPTAPCGCSLEVLFAVDDQPCSVLLHRPQRHQDVTAIQGEHCLPYLIFLSSSFLSANWVHPDWARKAFQVCLEGPLHPDHCLGCIVVRVGTNHCARGPFCKGGFFDWWHVG